MKKNAIVLSTILALLASTITGIHAVEVAQAQFFGQPIVWTDSPSSTVVYTNASIPLDVFAIVHIDSPDIVHFLYSVDENSNVTLANLNKTKVGIHPHEEGHEFYASSVLENLTEGNHTLKVYSQDTSGEKMSYSVEFMVDTNFKNPLLVLSPQNKTYTTSEIPLTFVCSEEIRRSDYQLDGIGEGPISGNLTLVDLSLGEHKIKVVVWTVRGVFSQTLYFSVLQPEPFPTTIAVVLLVIMAVIGLGILAYFKKQKERT